MKSTKKLMMGTALVAALALPNIAQAETIKKTTIIAPQELENTVEVNFLAFDLNNNNILSKAEVGEKLFEIFDTDGNHVIDNIEYDNKNVYTVVPYEKTTFTMVDYENDGKTDMTTYEREEFFKQTRLNKFNQGLDGLSAAEFIDDNFYEVDTDGNKLIEMNEWKNTYTKISGLPEDKRLETYLNKD